jgi:hypothetical protein
LFQVQSFCELLAITAAMHNASAGAARDVGHC